MQAADLNFPNKVLLDPCSPFAKEMVPSGLQRCVRWLVYALNVFLLGVYSHSFLRDHFLCRSSQKGLDSNLLPRYTQLVPALREVPTPPMESDPGSSTNRHSRGHLKRGSPGDFTEQLENRCYLQAQKRTFRICLGEKRKKVSLSHRNSALSPSISTPSHCHDNYY